MIGIEIDVLGGVGNALLNPLVIQLIIAIATVATVLVSFFSAHQKSELAATRLSFEISERKNHSQTLVDEPLSHLRPQMFGPEKVMAIATYYQRSGPVIVAGSSDFKSNVSKEPNKKFLISHLSTGYPGLFRALEEYDREFNVIASEVSIFYKDQVTRLQGIWIERGLLPTKIDYYGVIQSLSEDQGSIKRGSDPSRIGVDSVGQAYNLRYGSRTIFSGTGDFQNMIKALEDFRSDPSFQKQYDDLHNRALKLAEEADKIEEDLSLIQAYVRAGNFIKGSCEAGIDAGYEVKANETPFS